MSRFQQWHLAFNTDKPFQSVHGSSLSQTDFFFFFFVFSSKSVPYPDLEWLQVGSLYVGSECCSVYLVLCGSEIYCLCFSALSPHLYHHVYPACIPLCVYDMCGVLQSPRWDAGMLCAWRSPTLRPRGAASPQRTCIRVWICILLTIQTFSLVQFVLKCCWNWRFMWVLMSCRAIHAPYTASCHEFCQVGWNPVCQSLRLTPGQCLRARTDDLCVCGERGVSRSRMISRRSESHFPSAGSSCALEWKGGRWSWRGEACSPRNQCCW